MKNKNMTEEEIKQYMTGDVQIYDVLRKQYEEEKK